MYNDRNGRLGKSSKLIFPIELHDLCLPLQCSNFQELWEDAQLIPTFRSLSLAPRDLQMRLVTHLNGFILHVETRDSQTIRTDLGMRLNGEVLLYRIHFDQSRIKVEAHLAQPRLITPFDEFLDRVLADNRIQK